MDKVKLLESINAIKLGLDIMAEAVQSGGEDATPAPVATEEKVRKPRAKKSDAVETEKAAPALDIAPAPMALAPAPEKKLEAAPAEYLGTQKAFTRAKPATGPTEVKKFHEQWKALNAAQMDAYIRNEIDSLGRPIISEKPPVTAAALAAEVSAAPSLETFRNALKGLADRLGNDEAKKILAGLGVSKVSEIPFDKVQKGLDLIDAALNPPKKDEASFMD